MIWYTRHHFLEGISRHDSFLSWRSDVRERKSAAIQRAWPSPIETSRPDGAMLFIEDALSNLDTQQEYTTVRDDELEIASLQKDGGLSFSRVKIEGMVGTYPFKNLRSAIDILFLCGSSDLVVAKQAIVSFLIYYRCGFKGRFAIRPKRVIFWYGLRRAGSVCADLEHFYS